jgi:hypothetical protein
MADLTPLDEKLAEVLGLAQAAQRATDTVGAMEDAETFAEDLRRMHEQAAETERRTDQLVDGLEGKKTAIRDMARETKAEATDMMKTYLEGEEEALDGSSSSAWPRRASSATGRSSRRWPGRAAPTTSTSSRPGPSGSSASTSRSSETRRSSSPSRRCRHRDQARRPTGLRRALA